ncbi:MAG TPA: trypsin-like peptidase domain-containing protein [Gemmatimonadaceae bacterium]|jgi:serine protease Do|nr:trypsin-like peptidase domain-containing protein [Gemmatimonadaceae bacterium]
MSSFSSRARWTFVVAVAFLGGLLFASGMNWTHIGFAKTSPADLRPITDVNNAFVEIADRVTPAVVSIQVETKTRVSRVSGLPAIPRGMIPPGMQDFFNNVPERPSVQEASGSGFIVSKEGYILTNNHVVTGEDHNTVADKIIVQLLDHRRFTAQVVGHDPTTDIAVIKIDGHDLPTIPLGDDDKARVGEWVLAIGNPLGLDFTVTAGIVSAKGRSLPGLLGDGNRYAISDLLQTDAAINPGNSGGPLVNSQGQVIGVNSAIASQTGYYSGYGFAIPITLAKRVMDDLIAHGHVRFGVLGVAIGEVDADAAAVAGMQDIHGALVSSFVPDNDNNPAKHAGVEIGDVIVSADGKSVDKVSTLQRIVRSHAPGESVNLGIMRYGQQKTVTVKLMAQPSDAALLSANTATAAPAGEVASAAKLGIELAPIPTPKPAGFPASGVMVAQVEALGPAYGKLFKNDVITDILYPGPRKPVRSQADLQQALGQIKPGGYISLDVFAQAEQGSGVTRVVNIQVGGQ